MQESLEPNELVLATSIYRTANAVIRDLDRRLAARRQVTFVQAVTLMAIASLDNAQPHLVAEQLAQQSQTVTGVLDRLERAGYVRRVRDLDDRRAVRLELTEDGCTLLKEITEDLNSQLMDIFRDVDAPARSDLAAGLQCVESSVRHASVSA
jgi:DNA-binding MarR family transcriptional regulator